MPVKLARTASDNAKNGQLQKLKRQVQLVKNASDTIRILLKKEILGSPHCCFLKQLLSHPLAGNSYHLQLTLKKDHRLLVHTPDPPFTNTLGNEREQIHKTSLTEQEVLFKEERVNHVLKMADKIIEGKKKKAKEPFDEKQVLQNEMAKITHMPEDLMMVQIFTRPHWECQEEEILLFQLDKVQPLRTQVFVDLWKKGYFITAGEKFGGDFLVYPGDPLKFHSHYIAVCVEEHQAFMPRFLIQKGRLGTSVKKTVLLCSVGEDGVVKYQSFTWNGK
nr:EOG090X0G6M [Scapholeberis mucronata]